MSEQPESAPDAEAQQAQAMKDRLAKQKATLRRASADVPLGDGPDPTKSTNPLLSQMAKLWPDRYRA